MKENHIWTNHIATKEKACRKSRYKHREAELQQAQWAEFKNQR